MKMIDVDKGKMGVELEKLKLVDGDVLVVRSKNMLSNMERLGGEIRYMLDGKDLKNVSVIMLSEDVSVEVLSEKVMMKMGWMKKDKIVELLDGIEVVVK